MRNTNPNTKGETMKRARAIAEAKDWLRVPSLTCCIVYQYPKGHWACCSEGSDQFFHLNTSGEYLCGGYGRPTAPAKQILKIRRMADGTITVKPYNPATRLVGIA